MSGNLKIQILEIIFFEKLLPKFKSSLLSLYYFCETETKLQAVSKAFIMRDGQTAGNNV